MIAITSLIQADAVDRQEHIDEQVDADKEQGHRENKALNCGVVGGHQGLDREGSDADQKILSPRVRLHRARMRRPCRVSSSGSGRSGTHR